MIYLGLDAGHDTEREAEHWLSQLGLPAGAIACTHLVRLPWPHVAISVALPASRPLPVPPKELAEAAGYASEQHARGLGGRAFVFPGVDDLTGTLSVADLLHRSAIDAVTVIGGPPATPDTLVDTRDHVRPQWTDGRLVLVATPAPGGRIAPFELPNPTPCCAHH